MRFTEGDRVRHRGLKFISGVVIRVIRMPGTEEGDHRSCFCKVQLRNGQFYSDRATEWEPSPESDMSVPSKSRPHREEQSYAEVI